jgi:Integrase core domain
VAVWRKILGEHLARPRGLPHGATRAELVEPGLDIEDGCAVDGVEFLDMQVEVIDLDQTAARDTQPVQPAHVAMAEDADFGPVRVVSWSACAEVEVGRVGEMEAEDDF